jgi:alkylhydroperoxidase/carboxymuconolactone decarboxylase family protein
VSDSYYDEKHLGKFTEIGNEAPDLAGKFFEYYASVFAEGELTEREKALIALAVAHTVQCPYCIDAYTRACLEKGSNLTEMTEALHVAVAIRGGASLIHGLQMRTVAEKISM